jgi:uncharacterized small protein (DUF1192 family)
VTPTVTRDYFHRLPKRAVGLSKAREKVYLYVVENLDDEGYFAGTNPEIAEATGLHIGTVGPIVVWLAENHPPGVEHPYFLIEGSTRNRRIRVLYLPKGAPHKHSAIRMKNHSNPPGIRMKNHSNPRPARQPKTVGDQGLPSPSLFGPFLEDSGEKNDVDVVPIAENTSPRTHARGDAGPDPSGAREPAARAPSPSPAAPAPEAPAIADGVNHDLAGLSVEQLRERIAEMEGRKARLKARGRRSHPEMLELCQLIGLIGEARALLEARERSQGPAATPKVQSSGPVPAVAPAATPAASGPGSASHVETPDLIRRLISPSGAAVVDQVVARLCERLDPEFAGCFRRCCADVLGRRLDVGVMIAAFHWARKAPSYGRKKGPSFAGYIAHHRETRRPAFHPRK